MSCLIISYLVKRLLLLHGKVQKTSRGQHPPQAAAHSCLRAPLQLSLQANHPYSPVYPGSDLYDLRDQYKPHFLISKYDSLKHQLRQRGKGFKRILFEMFKTDILIGIVMSVIVALLIIESPLIMKKILAHIQTPKATVDETNAVRGVIKMWLGVFVIKIFFNEFTERKFFMVGLRLQLLLTNLFMRKITHLSLNSIHSSKPEVMNYLIVEIKKVEIFFKKGSWLFSQPPVLVLGMLMIFLKNFWLGFLTLQMVLGFVAIRILVNNHTDNAHHHKLELQEKRTYMNV